MSTKVAKLASKFEEKSTRKMREETTGGEFAMQRGLAPLMVRLAGKLSDGEIERIINAIAQAGEEEMTVAKDQIAQPGTNILVSKTAIVESQNQTCKVEQIGLTRLGDGNVVTDLATELRWCQVHGCGTLTKSSVRCAETNIVLCDRCKMKHPFREGHWVSPEAFAVLQDDSWAKAEMALEQHARKRMMLNLAKAEIRRQTQDSNEGSHDSY